MGGSLNRAGRARTRDGNATQPELGAALVSI